MSGDEDVSLTPPCRLLFRSKDGVEVFSLPSERSEEASIQKASSRNFLIKGITTFQALHPDGSAAFVHQPDKGIFKLPLNGKVPVTVISDQPFLKDTSRVQIVDMSPKGNFLLTWERAQEGELPNLKVWNTATGDMVAGFRQKTLKREAWPNLQWTSDESFAFLMGTNEVRVYPSSSFHGGEEVRFIDRLRVQGMSSMNLGPSASRILFTTFIAKDKNKPSRAFLHEYPSKASPPTSNANYPALLNKSLFQAEEMAVHWSPKGDSALIALQTTVDTSGKSYYGSTSLYLMSSANKEVVDVPLPQEGPALAVQWMPDPSKPPCFAVAAGRTPPMTSLHNGTDGKATFLFGNAHRNTIAWAPHGRFVCLAGFGNLAGGMTFWDRNKLKQIPPATGVTAACTVGYGWSPDSRLFSVSTTAPRMNVDNGVRVFRYNGDQVMNVPWSNADYSPNRLLEASFLPALPEVYPDRPQSPTLKDAVKDASVAASSKPTGRYVPPSARQGARGGSSLADRMKAEREAKLKGAQKVVDKPKSLLGASGKVVVGLAPAADGGKSKSALRREKAKQKKEEEEVRLVIEQKLKEQEAAAAAAAPVDPTKRAKKLNKILRQIEELKERDATTLNEDQTKKIASEQELRDELAKLGI